MSKHELGGMRELAIRGSLEAAEAFSLLVRREVRMRPPVLKVDETASKGLAELDSGVFFELEGCLDAAVGVFFPNGVRDAVVAAVLGEPEGPLMPESIEAVLMELGNIVVSRVASAIADALGERLLPSIPVLAMEDAGLEFAAWCESQHRNPHTRIECALADGQGELGSVWVLVPGRQGS